MTLALHVAPQKNSVMKVLTSKKSRLELVVDDGFNAEMEEAMHLLSHVNPQMDHGKLFQYLVRDFLKRKSPMRELYKKPKASKALNYQPANPKPNPAMAMEGSKIADSHASISSARNQRELSLENERGSSKRLSSQRRRTPGVVLKRQVLLRDGGPACAYLDPLTGKRCGSRHRIQFDHRIPYSEGGPTSEENLRLLCGVHNRYVYHRAAKYSGRSERI